MELHAGHTRKSMTSGGESSSVPIQGHSERWHSYSVFEDDLITMGTHNSLVLIDLFIGVKENTSDYYENSNQFSVMG